MSFGKGEALADGNRSFLLIIGPCCPPDADVAIQMWKSLLPFLGIAGGASSQLSQGEFLLCTEQTLPPSFQPTSLRIS